MLRRLATIPFLGIAVACNCDTRTQKGAGELKIGPPGIDFGETCVKPQDPSLEVQPVKRTLTLQNVGRGPLVLTGVTIPADKPFVVSSDWPAELGVAQTYDLEITYLPPAVGTHTAEITVDDDQPDVPAQKATLVGSGSTVTANPVAALACAGGRVFSSGNPASSCSDPVDAQNATQQRMWFQDTVSGQATEMTLTFKNAGCATLAVDALTVVPDPQQADAFVLLDDAGAVVTGSSAPFTVAGGIGADRPTKAIKLRFQPELAGTGTLNAQLRVATNVPDLKTIDIVLIGTSIKPSLELCTTISTTPPTTSCAVAAVQLTCDFSNPCTTTPQCTGNFEVRNSGSAPFDLTAIRLDKGTAQFRLDQVPALPKTMGPSATATFKVAYTQSTQFVYDTLTVVSTGGDRTAVVQGGAPPKLEIVQPPGDNPDDVDFNKDASGNALPPCAPNQTTGCLPNSYTGSKTFSIKNAGCGELKVSKVYFRETGGLDWPKDAPKPFFLLAPPSLPVVVPANGGTAPVKVTFSDPPNGGPSGSQGFNADLKIDSDDPLWPPPNSSKTVQVHAKTPCNPFPIPMITGPATSAPEGTITLTGDRSYDFKPDSNGECKVKCVAATPAAGCPPNPITQWEWKLQTVPPTGSSATLTPTGVTSQNQAALKLGACKPCSYVVRLWVYDDTPPTATNPKGLRSNIYTDFTVTAQ